ncbi:MAG: putative zinc-binding protein, partial [Candidatus Jordarchaeaceae archaeon]
ENRFRGGKSMEGKEGKTVIYACFGGFSNTGITTALASMDAVKEVGLDKVCIGCLGGLPINVRPVYENTDKAKKIITVDGCPMECSRKTVQNAGYKIAKSIVLARDIGMKKKSLYEGNEKNLTDNINEEDVRKAKELIVKAILEE